MAAAICSMCGILGFTGQPAEGQWGETHHLLESLFMASEHRGRHATGYVARTEPFKGNSPGGVVSSKAPITSSKFVARNGDWRGLARRRCSTVVGHVRWATHGPPEVNQNNHPFRGRCGLWMVHNGVLSDHEGICERRGLLLKSDCDSEAILRVVESAATPAEGLEDALRGLRGSMAVVIYDAREDCTYLARNEGRPLWLLRLRGDRRWFYASTREILLEAFAYTLGRRAYRDIELLLPIATHQVHVLSSNGELRGLSEHQRSSRTVWS